MAVKTVTLDTARRNLKNKHYIKVTSADLRAFLGDPDAVRIEQDAIERFITSRSDAPEPTPALPAEDEPGGAEPPAPSRDLVSTRRRQSKGAFEPTRLAKPKRLALNDADRQILQLMQTVLLTVKKFRTRRRESVPGRRGDMGVQDLLRPERWIWMPLAEFQARSDSKTLPVLHPDTIKELAEPLKRLSLVNHTCRICNQPMEPPYYKGMLEHLLAGNAELPFRPNDKKALKFPQFHQFCPAILEMMAAVEQGIVDMPEGEAKEAARWQGYIAKLQAEEGRMLSNFMQSEFRPLSAKEAMNRLRSINEHIKRQRELYS